MKTMLLLMLVSVVCGIFGSFKLAKAAAPATDKGPSALADANNHFAVDLYKHLAKQGQGDIFFSPESISLALGMTYDGARGQTAAEMAKALHFNQPADELNAGFATLVKQMNESGKSYQLSVANRLWGQAGYKFLDVYLKTTRDVFGAELQTLDFVHQAEQSRQTINAWVEKQTHDKIKDLIGPGVLGADTRLVLTNAIYFKGDWQSQFEKDATSKQPFHLTAANSASTDMMNQEKHFKFAHPKDVRILEMPYRGGDLSMCVLLPDSVDGLADLEKSLTTDQLKAWLGGLKTKNVSLTFPKFKATKEFELSKTLAAMGMPLAFTDQADFSGMDGKRDLAISAVIHKAFVAVDEKGTEAAAATAVAISALSMPVPQESETFNADHPFMFLIRDNRSGSILFMGRYTGPAADTAQ